jgi:hypothetical protein
VLRDAAASAVAADLQQAAAPLLPSVLSKPSKDKVTSDAEITARDQVCVITCWCRYMLCIRNGCVCVCVYTDGCACSMHVCMHDIEYYAYYMVDASRKVALTTIG